MRHLLSQIIRKDVIGTCQFVFHPHKATLNHIKLNPDYKNCGYGSQLLRITEQCLFHKYDVNHISTLVWQPQTDYTTMFFEKNGYIPSKTTHKYFDDGEVIYELVPYEKILNTSTLRLSTNSACIDIHNIHFTEFIL